MGYGIGTGHVDTTVAFRPEEKLLDVTARVGEAVASLLAAGCSRLTIDAHKNGIVVTGNRAVGPAEIEKIKDRLVREVLR